MVTVFNRAPRSLNTCFLQSWSFTSQVGALHVQHYQSPAAAWTQAAIEPAYTKDLYMLEIVYSNMVPKSRDSLPAPTVHVSTLFWEKVLSSGKTEVNFHLGIITLLWVQNKGSAWEWAKTIQVTIVVPVSLCERIKKNQPDKKTHL